MSDNPSRRMFSTLVTLSGIMKDKISTDIDSNMEAQKWREEFDERMVEI
jgi:hypothetical protein